MNESLIVRLALLCTVVMLPSEWIWDRVGTGLIASSGSWASDSLVRCVVAGECLVQVVICKQGVRKWEVQLRQNGAMQVPVAVPLVWLRKSFQNLIDLIDIAGI